ncbi:MAG: DNA mismatch repair protein MutS [Alphaproteobacteria bacterium]
MNKEVPLTPMMSQYQDIKKQYLDCLLFYRLGDFYELFFEDAIIASKILDITLTKRGKHDSQNIPMCGIPFHASDLYIPKLIKANYKIAICEQLETPEEAKKRGYKAVVKREVVRIITPGTITEENLLDGKLSNYLCSITKIENQYGISWLDISTGEFSYCSSLESSLVFDISRIDPREILISDSLYNTSNIYDILNDYHSKITTHVTSFFDYKRAELKLKSYYKINTLEGFDHFTKAEIAACGSILEYVSLTQKNNIPHLAIPKKLKSHCYMTLDPATKRSLEINSTVYGEKSGSLVSILDKTLTNAGARLLNHFLAYPLIDPSAINNRLNKVEFFIENENLRDKIIEVLKNISDIERATLRLIMGRGGPRDLNIIKTGLANSFIIAELFEYSGIELPNEILELTTNLVGHNALIKELEEAVKDEVSLFARDGNFIRPSFHPKLQELVDLQNNFQLRLENLRDTYRQETGISNLKIEQNNVIGYYIEISPQQSSKIQDNKFIHRQTLITGIRYTTLELKNLETSLINGRELISRIELQIFNELVSHIDEVKDKIFLTIFSIANIDVAINFSKLALEMNYSRPIIDNSLNFNIENGRHPVVEANFLKLNSSQFISNNCNLNENKNIWLLTGPNMAGKSTFLRQNALITIMAQIGSFVPASYAHIGVVDRVFSRVGAADDLAHGKSTFMVEMVETAVILNQATQKSLLILDEIGRGTSTYDGVSIAWSCLEYIHNKIKARTIFATHYHELTSLTKYLTSLVCYSMKIKEWDNKIVFLHEVNKGSVDKSYGIHVAKIAGLPDIVIKKAEEILNLLESSGEVNQKLKFSNDLPLFVSSMNTNPSIKNNNPNENTILINELKKINVNNLTPMQALQILHKLKSLI